MMNAHYLQHVPFEGLGFIGPWLDVNGYRVTSTRFFAADPLPDPTEVDLLIVLGGPMSVNDEAGLPWLVEEKRFIRTCIESGKAVLGVCLGAQMIASALGSRVYPNRAKEIGWFPIEGVPSVDGSVFRFPQAIDVFHWHGETFDLPAGTAHIARSQACEHQGFQLGRRVIALQFHLETTPEAAQAMVKNCGAELVPSEYVQSEDEILGVAPDKYAGVNRLMGQVLTYLRER